MPHRYTSFLLRHWQLAAGEVRITVEHIQTGAAITVASLAAATSWLGEQTAPGNPCEPPPPAAAPDAAPTGDLSPSDAAPVAMPTDDLTIRPAP